jgi:butyryl-CoA dehydrogenase
MSIKPRPTLWSDVFLNPDHITIAQTLRDFVSKELHPIAAKIDRDHMYPKEIIAQLSQMGFMGMMVPAEYGGSGLDTLSYTVALEEIGVACASTCVIMSVNNSLVCHPLEKYGTHEQKERFLIPLATGKTLGCYCLSEPGNGSDAAALKTRAVKKGNKWVLNGVKNWITNGREADVAIIYAVIDESKKHKGIGAFIVEKSAKGYSVGKVEEKLGILGTSTTQIILEDVEIPEDQLLGTEEDGFKIAMNTLDGGRIGIAAQAVGIARSALEEATEYSLEREAFGKPIAKLGAIQHHISEMSVRTSASRLLMRAAALKKDSGLPYTKEAAEAKLFASETAMDVATRGIQVLGGYGYTKEYPLERHFRDAKITEIYEGTSEIQRLVIAANCCKEAAR